MIAIRNSKLYFLIALLLSITTLVYAGFWAIVGAVILGIAAAVSIVIGVIQGIKWMVEWIKTEEQKLLDMKDDLKDANNEMLDNSDKIKAFSALVIAYDISRMTY